MQKIITDDLEALLDTLPASVAEPLRQREDRSELLEVVLDLGRLPEARFPGREITLRDSEVMEQDIRYVVERIGAFGDDNRAGIPRTLHRISAIRNRKGRIVGLTCRVGRAVFGTIGLIQDLVESGRSILLLGRPGVGKTTMLREVARVLADDLNKRVIIVDTSNEIGGDGDIPHPAIGPARRMQVATPALQHAVMIEAVENHMPEVIVIDEIGTELEAMAARTIAERGVQLVATAHGNTLENLIMNPTLSDLLGGIQTVTLGDEEARRRGTQKSVLERKAPPTFDVLVEIQSWDRVAIHHDVAAVVDVYLRGEVPSPEERWREEETGEVGTSKSNPPPREFPPREAGRSARILPFGLSRERLEQVARRMDLPIDVVPDLRDAEILITTKNHYRRRSSAIKAAEAAGLPIYVLRHNTVPQMEQCLASIYGIPKPRDLLTEALKEAEEAARRVQETGEPVDLSPQNAYLRRLQHQMADQYRLNSRSTGQEPFRRVRFSRGQVG